MTGISGFKADDEDGRLAALQRYEILDTEPEKEFGDIVALVRSIFSVESAAINLIDRDRQWTKAGAGTGPRQAERQDTICDHAIRQSRALMVPDTLVDERFGQNPFVLAPGGVRSYLGVPLRTEDGYNIGTLCVTDTVPRNYSDAEIDVLSNFARVVMSQLELRLSARVDVLTGVLTRRAFIERVDRFRQQRQAGPTTLLMIDIDHFKLVNDTFGHAAGDDVLRQVSATLAGLMRKSDSLGRLGGEEFGVLLPGARPEDAMHFVRRVQDALRKMQMPAINGQSVTLSMGLAGFAPGEDRQDWFARADRGLYEAKSAGRDQAVVARLNAG